MVFDAIYQSGVLKPLGETPNLRENERVRVEVMSQQADVDEWLERVQKIQDQIRARVGTLPDSTPDIAEDRLR